MKCWGQHRWGGLHEHPVWPSQRPMTRTSLWQRAHGRSLCRHRSCWKQLLEPHTVAGHGQPPTKFREQQQRLNHLSGNHGCHMTCNLQTLETAVDVEGTHKEWCFLCQRNRRRACMLWISLKMSMLTPDEATHELCGVGECWSHLCQASQCTRDPEADILTTPAGLCNNNHRILLLGL